MADAEPKNRILVLGRPEINKSGLINAVIHKHTSVNVSENDSDASKVPWTILTKYYTAPVEFWIDSTEELNEDEMKFIKEWVDGTTPVDLEDDVDRIPVSDDMKLLQEHLSEVVDAIIFVFDPKKPDSFTDILPWARYGQLFNPNILLCVALGRNDIDYDEESKDQWFNWCVGNAWEWLDLTDNDPETEYTIERIREALENNEWENMKLKTTSINAINSSNSAEVTQKQAGNTICQVVDSEPDNTSTSAPIIKKELGDNMPRLADAKGLEEWENFGQVSKNVDQNRIDSLHRQLFPPQDCAAGETADDNDNDDMAAALSKINLIKEQISKMDPEQARIRAAELAMAIAKKL